MKLTQYLRPKTIALVTMALLLGVLVYGFAASNEVPVTGAGDGEDTIAGYVVNDVEYTLNGANPGTIDSVTFNLTGDDDDPPKPEQVIVQLVSTGGWYDCGTINNVEEPWEVSCTIGDVAVADADQLRVIAGNVSWTDPN